MLCAIRESGQRRPRLPAVATQAGSATENVRAAFGAGNNPFGARIGLMPAAITGGNDVQRDFQELGSGVRCG